MLILPRLSFSKFRRDCKKYLKSMPLILTHFGHPVFFIDRYHPERVEMMMKKFEGYKKEDKV